MQLEELGFIGNCQYSALIDNRGAVAWCCLPRFDSEPVFASLLDTESGGSFSISHFNEARGVQFYIENTNVLVTQFSGEDGTFRVIDFAPRFNQYDRSFRPTKLVRIIEPVSGTPSVKVCCNPILGWSKERPRAVHGSNHIVFEGYSSQLRLTSDVPLSYINNTPFVLTGRKHMILSWGEPVEEPLDPLAERFLRETIRYWQTWIKNCSIPPHYQKEVVRSALVLKLHCFEDTGAIVASTTTSLPEAPGSKRTWDYRYCWLRDASYALNAFRLLGRFEERESFINFLLNVAPSNTESFMAPLYRVDGRTDLTETSLLDWPGYKNERPVRVGNHAVTQTQNDIYGEMVLALTPIFLDERFKAERTDYCFRLMHDLTRRAIEVAGTPDAGIWEFRSETPRVQTFSALMSWAAADRMGLICGKMSHSSESHFKKAAGALRKQIMEKAWNGTRSSFCGTFGGSDLDASLLQMAPLRFLPPSDSLLGRTIETISKTLTKNGYLVRYNFDDGFGHPEVAFLICSFWLVEALVYEGKIEKARTLLDKLTKDMKPLGLMSEDIDTSTGLMWGNFPQAYSHVGLINAAFAASPRWVEIL